VFSNIAANVGGSLSVVNTANTTVASLTDNQGTVSGVTAPGGVIINSTANTLTLNGIISANTAGVDITLNDNVFVNTVGSNVLSTGAGNFQVWSGNPANDTLDGLVYNYKQYDATYGSTAVLGTGNGLLYTVAPIITPVLTGTVSKVYDATNNATLTSSNYTSSGAIDGDTIILNNPTSGTYDTVNVGSNLTVSVSGISIASATNGSVTVYGYQVIPTANAAIGIITQRPITISSNPGLSVN